MSSNSYSKIQRTNDMADIEEDVYKSSASSWEYWRALIQDMQEHTFASKKHLKHGKMFNGILHLHIMQWSFGVC